MVIHVSYLGADIKSPLQTMGGVRSGRGQLSRKIFAPARDFFESDQKLLPVPPKFEKNIAHAVSKAAWVQVPYWVHFTFKVSNPIYMCIFT